MTIVKVTGERCRNCGAPATAVDFTYEDDAPVLTLLCARCADRHERGADAQRSGLILPDAA